MRLMISGATRTMDVFAGDLLARRHLGAMVTPNSGNSLERVCSWGLPWCVDNAAFRLDRFSGGRFLELCRKAKDAPYPPEFVVVPDQAPRPGDADHTHLHDCTSYLFERW